METIKTDLKLEVIIKEGISNKTGKAYRIIEPYVSINGIMIKLTTQDYTARCIIDNYLKKGDN